jgi:hypothetical protein
LSYDEDTGILNHVAKHPNTPVEVLVRLASGSYDYDTVHLQIAKNRKTPSDVLAQLAHHTCTGVLYEVRRNPNASKEVQEIAFENYKTNLPPDFMT